MKKQLRFLAMAVLGFVMISHQLYAAPTNDLFVNRTALTGTNLTVQGDDTGASVETGEPSTSANLYYSLWYEWTAPSTGIFYFTLGSEVSGSYYSLGVYRGTVVNALTPVSLTPDHGV